MIVSVTDMEQVCWNDWRLWRWLRKCI